MTDFMFVIENESWRLHGVATQGTPFDQDDLNEIIDAINKLNKIVDELKKVQESNHYD